MNLLTLQKTKSGAMARNFTSYGTDDGALSAFHQSIRASIADENILSCISMLITDNGTTTKREAWEREVTPEE